MNIDKLIAQEALSQVAVEFAIVPQKTVTEEVLVRPLVG